MDLKKEAVKEKEEPLVEDDASMVTATKPQPLLYGLDDCPPWHLTLLFAIQLVLTNIGGCIIMSSLISTVICANQLFTSKLFATSSVMAGLTTVFQTLIGARMPIFQGPTLLGILPYIEAYQDPRWRCRQNMTQLFLDGNVTGISPDDNPWDEMWSKVQGSMLIGTLIEATMGFTGLVGLISHVVRPITIAGIFILITVYIWEIAATIGSIHWGVSVASAALSAILALYLSWWRIPIPVWSRAKGWRWTRFPLLEFFPILIVILIMWLVSHVITLLGGFTDDPSKKGYQARTDIYADNIRNSPALRVPYPGQFGRMDFDVNYIIFYIPCMMASMIESIADYYQYAVACQSPRPPPHAINRGIAIEGIGGMVSAWLGAGHPTTSYSNMMGIICITRVGSCIVMVVAGVILTIIGMIGPLGSILVSIPSPVMFGPLFLAVSLLAGSAFDNLRFVDIGYRRNQTILGITIFLAIVISYYIKYTPNAINSGSKLFNDVASGIFKIPFITGGIISVFLDVTLRGREKQKEPSNYDGRDTDVYDPPFVGKWMRRHRIFRYIPFLPGPASVDCQNSDVEEQLL